MEKKILIDTPDNHKIYGTLNAPDNSSDKLVIFIHGFTGNSNEHIFFNGAKELNKNNIASFRFDLYSWEEGARHMPDCDIKTHVDDLTTVFDHFKDKYRKIYLIGHSLGGIVVLESALPASAYILWDPSYASTYMEANDYKYVKELDAYTLDWGVVYVIGKKMREDDWTQTSSEELMSMVKCPVKIINAEKGVLTEGGQNYFKFAKEPKSYAIIKNAGHTFDEEGTEEELFKETIDWIKRN